MNLDGVCCFEVNLSDIFLDDDDFVFAKLTVDESTDLMNAIVKPETSLPAMNSPSGLALIPPIIPQSVEQVRLDPVRQEEHVDTQFVREFIQSKAKKNTVRAISRDINNLARWLSTHHMETRPL
jgi:hypothetical protein